MWKLYFNPYCPEAYETTTSEDEAIKVRQQADVQYQTYPPKHEQLIAALHIIITKKMKKDNCEKFMQKKAISSQGLYINKALREISLAILSWKLYYPTV